ncbi:MAG: T9SS type A sorting domain-containing protein [Saprospiraceae bacterium]
MKVFTKLRKIKWAMLLLTTFSLSGQTQLSKVVISNGGQSTSNNIYSLNLTIGQSFAAKAQSLSSEACIGFWYKVNGTTSFPFVLEKYKVEEKVVLNKPGKGANLKIYPNPFFDKAQIEFELAESGITRLSIVDVQGREIDLLANEYMTSGRYKFTYQSHASMSGVYTLMLITGKERLHKGCILLQ